MMRHNVKWQVSLSNGLTIFEDKGDYIEKEGAPSPWQRLLAFLDNTNVYITSLSLYTDEGQHWSLPSAGKNPKFAAFYEAPKPLGFACFRKLGMDVATTGETSGEQLFTVAQAQVEGGFLEIWVDEKNPLNSWVMFSKLSSQH